MKTYTLDLTPFTEAKALQSYLMKELEFPFYYGRNLDALYEELTSWGDAVCFKLVLPAQPVGGMADYLPRLVQVFRDAANEMDSMQVEVAEA